MLPLALRCQSPFGLARIRTLRVAKGWSQGELAERANIRPNTLSEALHEHTSPRLETLQAIASALDVPMWRLFVEARQAAILEQQEMAEAATVRAIDLAARVEQMVMTRLAGAVKDATREAMKPEPVTPPSKARSRKRTA